MDVIAPERPAAPWMPPLPHPDDPWAPKWPPEEPDDEERDLDGGEDEGEG